MKKNKTYLDFAAKERDCFCVDGENKLQKFLKY